MYRREAVLRKDQTTIWLEDEFCNGSFDLGRLVNGRNGSLHSEVLGSSLRQARRLYREGSGVWVEHNTNVHDTWRDLAEQFEPLPSDAGLQIGETGYIAAWPAEAFHKAGPHRVAHNREDDRNVDRCLMEGAQRRRAVGQDYVGHRAQQVRDGSPDPFDITRSPSIVDPKIAAGCPAELLQPMLERGDPCRRVQIARGDPH